MMRFVLGLSIICLALLAPGSAHAEKFGADFDASFDFSTLKSYHWRTHPVMEENPGLAQVAIAGDIVMSEGNEILMKRGYIPDDFEPDFYIGFFVKGKAGSETTVVGSSWYNGPGTAWTSYESYNRQFVDGTLVIDIVDAKSKQLVWRASYSDKVTNWKKRHKVISKAVKKSFSKFPPKQKKK